MGMGIQVYGISCPKALNQENLLRKCFTIRKCHPGNPTQEMFICLFADVPGELIFGSLVDASCTLWSSGGSCSSYNTTYLRIGLFGVAAIAR